MQMLFRTKCGETIESDAVLCHAREEQAMGDGRLIALSMETEAVITAARPDSISDVSVSPLIFSLMSSSPFLSSLLLLFPGPYSFPLLSPTVC